MADLVWGAEKGLTAQPLIQTRGPLLTPGYCADCGTWDMHTRICVACGYDFAASSDQEVATLAS